MNQIDQKELDYSIKLILLGNSRVGKTALIKNFLQQQTNDTPVLDFSQKIIELEGKKVLLQVKRIGDVLGNDKFRAITKSYYRDLNGILLIYSIIDGQSFSEIKYWLKGEIEELANENRIVLLVGNKTDLENERQVKFYDAQQFANLNNLEFIETSAKICYNVDNAFYFVVKYIVEQFQLRKFVQNDKQQILSNQSQTRKSTCC